MKFLVVGDLHIKTKSAQEVVITLQEIVKISKERILEYEFIVILGDIFDSHERITITELMIWDKFLKELREFNKEIFILIGNHDRPKNTCFMTDEHPLNSYKDYKGVTIVDTTIVWEFLNKKFLFVPYVPVGRFSEAIEKYLDNINDISCLFTHQEFKGVTFGKITSKKGDMWNIDYPQIINGHIHNYEKLGNITCIGSVHQVAFNESPRKTISLFTLNEETKVIEEERIECNPIKNIEIRLTKDEIADFNMVEMLVGNLNNFKLIVDADRQEINHIIKLYADNPRIKIQFLSKNKKIIVSNGTTTVKRRTYMECVQSLLEESLDLKSLFEDIVYIKEKKPVRKIIINIKKNIN